MKYVLVSREAEENIGRETKIDLRIDVPHKGSVFPEASLKSCMNKTEVARST